MKVRENNYYEEDSDESISTIEIIDSAFDPERRNRTEHYIEQSAIIYYDKTNNNNRLTQNFQFDVEKLVSYINQKKLVLYISRTNENDYVFDLES